MEFDAIGSFLGTFLGAREANQRKKALDADIAKATTPLGKLDAISKHNPSVWKDPNYLNMYAKMTEFQDQQDAKALLENKRAGFDVLLGSLPAEQRPAAIRDWGAGIVPDNQYSAATNQQFQTTGNENAIQSANVANERAIQADLVDYTQSKEAATTLFGRQMAMDATNFKQQQQLQAQGSALAEGRDIRNEARAAALRETIPEKLDVSAIDRVDKTNNALGSIEQLKGLLNETGITGLTGANKAKANALRSKIATGVMLASGGKSDADYAIALERVPDIAALMSRDVNSAATLDVLYQDMMGANENNKKLFGGKKGVSFFEPASSKLPAGFRVAKPKQSQDWYMKGR